VYELDEGHSVETTIPGASTTTTVATIRAETKNGETKVDVVSGKCEVVAVSLVGKNMK
jgi:hypothetical protein